MIHEVPFLRCATGHSISPVSSAHNHLFLGNSIRLFFTLENQAVTATVAERFLGNVAEARCAVPLLMPNSAEIAAQECP